MDKLRSILKTLLIHNPDPNALCEAELAIDEYTSTTFVAEIRTLRADLATARHDEFCSRRICETAVSSKKSLERQLEVERARVVPSVEVLVERNETLEREVAELRKEVTNPCSLQLRARELRQELADLGSRFGQGNARFNRLDRLVMILFISSKQNTPPSSLFPVSQHTTLVLALDALYPRATVERRRVEWLRTHDSLSFFDAEDASQDGPSAEDVEDDGGGGEERAVRRRVDDDDDGMIDGETAALLGID